MASAVLRRGAGGRVTEVLGMHPQGTKVSARRALLEELIDDAGLFPPASLDLAEALAVDDAARAGGDAWMLRRFIVPAGRLTELVALRTPAPGQLPLSVIVDAAHVARDLAVVLDVETNAPPVVTIESIELRLAGRGDGDLPMTMVQVVADIDASGLPHSVAVYLECAFGRGWRAHLTTAFDAMADARARSAHPIAAKLRCGGAAAEATPTPEQLAFAIGTLRALAVPFKATAGLHHPVRGLQQEGAVMHGFLNVLGVAVLDYQLDLDERTRQRVLADDDPTSFRVDDEAFGWKDAILDGAQVASARREFVHSFGSCSFSEPVDDLRALGILT